MEKTKITVKIVKTSGVLLCLFGALLGTIGCQDRQSDREMKISIGVPPAHFEAKAMNLFEEYVEKNTEDLDVIIYPANALGVDNEALALMHLGTVDMNLPTPAVLANFAESFHILALPYLFSDHKMADAITSGPWGKELLATLEGTGLTGLGFGPLGFRHLTNSIREVKTPEDLKGLKIRTMESPTHLAFFRSIGANPTPMAFTELFSSLKQGTVDGQENPLSNIASFHLYEAQPYLTLTGHVYEWVVFVVSQRFYDSLSAEEKIIVQQAADIAIKSMRKAVLEENQKSRKIMEEYGVLITDLTLEEKDLFRETGQETIDKAGMKTDPVLYEKLKQAIAAYRAAH